MFNKKRKQTEASIAALTAEIEALRGELTSHGVRADHTSTSVESITERLSRLESTVTGLGAELSRQLHELGSDLESLVEKVDDDSTAKLVESVKAAQVRLANEQARYEIAFRQDLAALAESLKRGK